VSPYTTPRWLDRFRSLMLPVPSADRERLVATLAPILSEHDLG